MQKTFRIPAVCLPWLLPRLGDAWSSSHHWSGIFSSLIVKFKLTVLTPCPCTGYIIALLRVPNGIVYMMMMMMIMMMMMMMMWFAISRTGKVQLTIPQTCLRRHSSRDLMPRRWGPRTPTGMPDW